jgi:hypothetical protein
VSDYYTVWNDRALDQALNSPDGPVARDLARRGARVETVAKQYASGFGGGPNVRTGRLRAGIAWLLGRDSRGLYAQVGTNVEYGPYVELGTDRMAARPFLRPAAEHAR